MSSYFLLATGNLLLGALVLLLGVLILRENARQRLNRVVSALLLFGGVGAIVTGMGFLAAGGTNEGRGVPGAFLRNFAYLWEFFFPTLFLFASIFPWERPFTRRFKTFLLVIYVPHAVHFVLLLALSLLGSEPDLSRWNTVSLIRPVLNLLELVLGLFLAIHRSLFSLVNLGFGVASVVLLAGSYRRTKLPRLRAQIQVIGIGLTLCLALYAAAFPVPVLLNVGIPEALQALLNIAALTVGSGAITYSIVRYKFLDAKLLVRRGILYALVSAAAIGFYLVVITHLNNLMSRFLGMETRFLEPVLLITALILFQPTLARFEERIDRLFLRDPNDYRNVLRRLGRELRTAIDLDEMLATSIRTVGDALLLRRAYLVALAREGPMLHTGAGTAPDRDAVARLGGILERLPEDRESVRLDDPGAPVDPGDRDLLELSFGASLVLPLRSKGETVGGMLLGEKVTGTAYTSEDVSLLTELTRQMSISVQNGLLLRDRLAMARTEEELNLARRIQRTFLPSTFPRLPSFDIHAVNTPSRQVGGDFYDLVPLPGGGFYLAIADVSGKGVPAALLTAMLQASLRTQARTGDSVSGIVTNINSLIHSSTTLEQFATFFLARVDDRSRRMVFSNAGHNYPIVFRRRGGNRFLEKGGTILGMFESVPFEEDVLDLDPGDRVLFYTDGVTEAVDARDEEYGEERLLELVASLPASLSAREITERVLDDLAAFLGGREPQDDVTIMVLRVLETADATRREEGAAVAAAMAEPPSDS